VVTMEVTVGPPVLTINQGATFMVTDMQGEIPNAGEFGVFVNDTRLVSYYRLYANNVPWTWVTSGTTAYYAARIHLVNQEFRTDEGSVPAGALSLTILRSVGRAIHEDFEIRNYSLQPVRFDFEISLRSDFADIFEVRWHNATRRGTVTTEWRAAEQALYTTYRNGDFRREFTYRLKNLKERPHYANGRITIPVTISPGEAWYGCGEFLFDEESDAFERIPALDCRRHGDGRQIDDLRQRWRLQAPTLDTDNEDFFRLYRQSLDDLGALRLRTPGLDRETWVAAAGVPWYVTIFGRDSLIVGLQCLPYQRGFALGALQKLAELQARERDDLRDAQPGKILHEIRFGELAHFRKIVHTPYYGTADATLLYLITLHETWKWTGDDRLLHRYYDTALRCLEWIDRDGDYDGDGFQEDMTRSPRGYPNQGWKDSIDAIVYPDGSQVQQPKALCELQGYVFDAWLRMAEIFDHLGERGRAAELRAKAAVLQRRFEERFWCEEEGIYALTLDPAKAQVCTVASNAGHCLWSGIAGRGHAARVVQRLLQPDMRSGWGIRTLSSRNPAYNPHSYQRGSVWPHDNSIIALGMRRYGFAREALQVASEVFDAARCFTGYRVPELYAGLQREPDSFPVQYLGANVPQAWAAGAMFQLLQCMLGLRADAPAGKVYVDPVLPRWLGRVTLRGVRVGAAEVDLHVWRDQEGHTFWKLLELRGEGLSVEQQPWQPWSLPEPAPK
jgi:glycogen debranching enzyme